MITSILVFMLLSTATILYCVLSYLWFRKHMGCDRVEAVFGVFLLTITIICAIALLLMLFTLLWKLSILITK